jgi:hypothetical protein
LSSLRTLGLLCAVLAAAVPAGVVAQETPAEGTAMWQTTVKHDARDVVAFGDGYVLVGGRDRQPQGKAWTSADGSTWQRVPDDQVFDGAVLRSAAAFDGGVVALGTEGRKLLGWYSPDGVTWQRTTIDTVDKGVELFPAAVTDGPAGLVAVASMVTQDLAGQRFYVSADGQRWQEVEPPSETATGVYFSLDATDDEYILVGRPFFGPPRDLYWRSPDGLAWEAFEGPQDGVLIDLAVGADGTFVAVGTHDTTLVPMIWRADELGTWEVVYEAPSEKVTEERLEIVAAAGSGFLAGGSTSACPTQESRYCPVLSLLVSDDGREWRALGIEDGVPGPLHDTQPWSVATNGVTTAVLAWHDERPAEVWIIPASG